jgi:hypothetical protein
MSQIVTAEKHIEALETLHQHARRRIRELEEELDALGWNAGVHHKRDRICLDIKAQEAAITTYLYRMQEANGRITPTAPRSAVPG